MKNNADMFDERGDPWEGDDTPLSHSRRPEGVPLKLSRAGIIYNLTHSHTPTVVEEEETHSTQYCLPIHIRLAKERNTRIDSMTKSSKPASTRSALISARAKLNARRASHLIKVK